MYDFLNILLFVPILIAGGLLLYLVMTLMDMSGSELKEAIKEYPVFLWLSIFVGALVFVILAVLITPANYHAKIGAIPMIALLVSFGALCWRLLLWLIRQAKTQYQAFVSSQPAADLAASERGAEDSPSR